MTALRRVNSKRGTTRSELQLATLKGQWKKSFRNANLQRSDLDAPLTKLGLRWQWQQISGLLIEGRVVGLLFATREGRFCTPGSRGIHSKIQYFFPLALCMSQKLNSKHSSLFLQAQENFKTTHSHNFSLQTNSSLRG